MTFDEKTPVQDFLMPLAQAIRHHRKLKEWTQDDLAKQIGVSRVAIAMYELGRMQPTYQTLIKLAQVLEFSLDTLCGVKNG